MSGLTLSLDPIREALLRDASSWHAPALLAEVDSTNDEARRMVDRGLDLTNAWLLVTTDKQRRGRGRRGHGWFSLDGHSIALTLAAQLALPAPVWPRASLVVGAALADAIGEQTGVALSLKWPNDLLAWVDGGWRKVAGILCERHEGGVGPASSTAWIAGIGVNVSGENDQFPAILRDHVTTMEALAGDPVPRTELLVAVALKVRAAIEGWQRRGGELDTEAITSRLAFIDAPIFYENGDGHGAQRATLRTIAADGQLVVEREGATTSVSPLRIVGAGGQRPWQIPPRLQPAR